MLMSIHRELGDELRSRSYELEKERISLRSKLERTEQQIRKSSIELNRLNPSDPQHETTRALIDGQQREIGSILKRISQIEESEKAVNSAIKRESLGESIKESFDFPV